MNQTLRTIFIILVIAFGVGIFQTLPAKAQTDELVVEYWTGTEWKRWLPSPDSFPIFSETNFAPGDSVTRLVRVTNNSDVTKRIGVEAINYPAPIPDDDLSRALMIVIGQDGRDLYGGSSPTGPKSLYDFYKDSETYSEIYLSDIESKQSAQYDFTISFPSEKENEWQGKTTHFDILIGFQETTSPPPPSPPTPPGPTGGGLPPGLTIQEESIRITAIGETSVTITWTTSHFSTSQVIYAKEGEAHTLDLTDNTGAPPKYGYAHTTPEYDTSPKVTFHSVTITGLEPATKYYCRVVSHGSLAISRELSFITAGVKGEMVEEKMPPEKIPSVKEEIPTEEKITFKEEIFPSPKEKEKIEKPSEKIPEKKKEEIEEITEKPVPIKEKPLEEILTPEGLLATIGGLSFNQKLILALIVGIIIGLIALFFVKKRKKKATQRKLIR